jgi:hypothetical protein
VYDCSLFETAITKPTSGIQCDLEMVYQHPHPYTESRGNIVFSMLLQLTVQQVLQQGLWCDSYTDCMFNEGGLFISTTVAQLLFTGFSDPSVLKYLSLKHGYANISFTCAENAVLACGASNLVCNEDGVIMNLPNNNAYLLRYNYTPMDEYFAPFFLVNRYTGEMYWPHAMNATVAAESAAALQELGFTGYSKYLGNDDSEGIDDYLTTNANSNPNISAVVQVFNPMWAAYPAWDSGDVAFLKYIQCSKRYFGGLVGIFANCEDTLNTGAVTLTRALNIQKFNGNDTLKYYSTEFPVNGSTFPDLQNRMYLWNGFSTLPYAYFQEHLQYGDHEIIHFFDKKYGHYYPLTQSLLVFEFEREISMPFPVRDEWEEDPPSYSQYTPLRRFQIVYLACPFVIVIDFLCKRRFAEDSTSWAHFRTHGEAKDSYGMPYNVPIGMGSLERTAGYPLFVSFSFWYCCFHIDEGK